MLTRRVWWTSIPWLVEDTSSWTGARNAIIRNHTEKGVQSVGTSWLGQMPCLRSGAEPWATRQHHVHSTLDSTRYIMPDEPPVLAHSQNGGVVPECVRIEDVSFKQVIARNGGSVLVSSSISCWMVGTTWMRPDLKSFWRKVDRSPLWYARQVDSELLSIQTLFDSQFNLVRKVLPITTSTLHSQLTALSRPCMACIPPSQSWAGPPSTPRTYGTGFRSALAKHVKAEVALC